MSSILKFIMVWTSTFTCFKIFFKNPLISGIKGLFLKNVVIFNSQIKKLTELLIFLTLRECDIFIVSIMSSKNDMFSMQ